MKNVFLQLFAAGVRRPALATCGALAISISAAGAATFNNLVAITIPDSGVGTPYPSSITVAGLNGTISTVTVKLNSLSHTWADDIDVLLVSPTGQEVLLMSDAGGGSAPNNVTLTLADGAAAALSDNGQLATGTFKPTNFETTTDTFAAPAPASPYATTLSAFNGQMANGVWSLYVTDDGPGDQGMIAGGWNLTITTTGGSGVAPTISDIVNQATTVNTATPAIPFTVNDTDTSMANLTLGKSSSNATLVPNGNIVFGGSGTNRTVTVTPATGQTGTATITVSVSDGQLSASDSFVLTVSAVATGSKSFTNTAAITIPGSGAGTPYPSTINVAGLGGTIAQVMVKLNSINHTYPDDVDILLVGPSGQKVMVFSDVGGASGANNVTVTLGDAAASALPDNGPLVAGTFKPTDASPGEVRDFFPAPAPGGPYATTLSAFNGLAANGNWSLYANDDGAGDAGTIVGGWSLTITTTGGGPGNATPTISDIPNQSTAANTPTPAVPFIVGDVEAAAGSLVVSGNSSNPALVSNGNIVFGGSGANRTVTVTPTTGQTGTATITVSVSDGQLSASDSFVLTVSAVAAGSKSFTNTAVITIPDSGTGTPYPSTINVAGLSGAISAVTLTLKNFSHTYPGDVDMLLVGPGGQRVMIFSDAGGASGVNNVSVTLSDTAASALPINGPLVSGTLRPTNYDTTTDTFASPAPSGPYSTLLSAFNGAGANGTWSLYVRDDGAGDAGAIAGGWSITITTGGASAPSVPTTTGPLIRLAANPRYFTDGSGKAIYLTGSHTWGNNRDYGVTDPPPPFDFTLYLNFLQSHNHNFFRLWTWEMPHSEQGALAQMWWRLPFPWPRTGPGVANDGKPKFDLAQFNQAYFDRLRARVTEARNRGMYVAVMLWDGFGLQVNPHSSDGFPFTAGNNINGLSSDGITSQSLVNAAVTAVQEAYARKVIDTVNDLDNVLYEIVNEAGGYSTAWQYHMINFIKQYEAGKPKQHPVGMTFQYSGGSDATLYNSPADWISTSEQYPVSDGTKVIVNDTDHSYYYTGLIQSGPAVQQAWVWKNFVSGNNTLFMDPYLVVWTGRNAPTGTTPDPYWNVLRKSLGYTRLYADKMNLAAMTPRPSLASSGNCLANPGSEYLVYAGSGNFTLTAVPGTYRYEWFNPNTGAIAATGNINATSNQSFTAPFSGDSVLYLKSSSIP